MTTTHTTDRVAATAVGVSPSARHQLVLDGQAAGPDGPVDVAAMYVMHRAFRRNLDSFVAAMPTMTLVDRPRWARVARRFALLAVVLHKHHHGEDIGLWPLLAERGADPAVLAELVADHVAVDVVLEAIGSDLRALADGTADRDVRVHVMDAMGHLRDVLGAHLAREERHGMALVQQHLSQADWDRLEEEVFSKGYRAREVPAVLGWVMSGLPPDAVRRVPGGDSPLFRAFGRWMARRTERRDARTFGASSRKARTDRALVAVSRYVGAAHTRVLRATGWRVGARWMGGDVLLLTHTGRRSGRPHTTPLLHVRDGEDLVVAASNGGIDHEPQWWLNLQVDPDGVVEVGGRRTPVVASEVTGADRQRLWGELVERCSNYDGYQASVTRRISVVRLAPR